MLRVITAMLPHLAPCARRIVERLEQRAPYGEAARATLHGDLHLHNILVDRGRVALVDMDDLCRGPAELELGSFVAALSYRAALHGDPAMHDAAAARFLEGYHENAPRPVCPAHVRWYAAAALIHERTWRCLTSLKPGRLERIEGLLSAAGALAA